MKKYINIPRFKSDKEAEIFVTEADLTKYDLSAFKPVRFVFAFKPTALNIRKSD